MSRGFFLAVRPRFGSLILNVSPVTQLPLSKAGTLRETGLELFGP